jgi:hypothetical protein
MFIRYRTLTTILALALQATDGIVGVFGHSHRDDHVACEAKCEKRACRHCSHRCNAAEEQPSKDHDSQRGTPARNNHDDCPICQHFSQPVAPTAITIEVVASQQSETIAPHYVVRLVAADRPIHPARGPPVICC